MPPRYKTRSSKTSANVEGGEHGFRQSPRRGVGRPSSSSGSSTSARRAGRSTASSTAPNPATAPEDIYVPPPAPSTPAPSTAASSSSSHGMSASSSTAIDAWMSASSGQHTAHERNAGYQRAAAAMETEDRVDLLKDMKYRERQRRDEETNRQQTLAMETRADNMEKRKQKYDDEKRRRQK